MLYEGPSGPQSLDGAVYGKIKSQLSAWSDKCFRNIALNY